jgi:hypothetical protein
MIINTHLVCETSSDLTSLHFNYLALYFQLDPSVELDHEHQIKDFRCS